MNAKEARQLSNDRHNLKQDVVLKIIERIYNTITKYAKDGYYTCSHYYDDESLNPRELNEVVNKLREEGYGVVVEEETLWITWN